MAQFDLFREAEMTKEGRILIAILAVNVLLWAIILVRNFR